ncbi:MAG TPA: DUF222 domain-containing protein, partial [Mycobacterium sp.]|nr:DUF222 domain-containing protein [Mycobacterium sp.]
MRSMQFRNAKAAYAAVASALAWADSVPVEGLSDEERLTLLAQRREWRRRIPAGEHALINEVAKAAPETLGDTPARALADRLRITRSEARRCIEEAADLGPRYALTGEPLAAKLEYTAAGQRTGLIGGEHVKIIRAFF